MPTWKPNSASLCVTKRGTSLRYGRRFLWQRENRRRISQPALGPEKNPSGYTFDRSCCGRAVLSPSTSTFQLEMLLTTKHIWAWQKLDFPLQANKQHRCAEGAASAALPDVDTALRAGSEVCGWGHPVLSEPFEHRFLCSRAHSEVPFLHSQGWYQLNDFAERLKQLKINEL